VLWRAGLRIGEAMALTEPDLDPGRGSVLIRQGKGGKRREVGMDQWGFDSSVRGSPVGSGCRSARCSALSTARRVAVPGRRLPRATTCGGSQPRLAYVVASRRTSSATRIRSRWHAKASSSRQRQLRHVNLGVTSVYLDGIDTAEIIDTVHNRRPPMISASAGLMI
jgi:integrase